MKPRHVRAVAAFGFVPVALTGAGSSGGGCGSHGGSSGKKSGSTRTGQQRTGRLKPGTASALRDVRIVDCRYDDAAERPAVRVAVRNGGGPPYVYGLAVEFTTGTGAAAASTTAFRGDAVIGAGASADLGLQALAPAPGTVHTPSGASSKSAGRVVQP